MTSATSPRNTILLLGAILLLAFGLRLYHADQYGIFFDEKSTLLVGQGVCIEGANQKDVFQKKYFTPADYWRPKTIADYLEADARNDLGSPFYFIIVWAWTGLFGLSDLSLRMPSILFSTFTILLLYGFVTRYVKSVSTALIACTVMAVEPFFVAYSQIARTYSVTFFMTLLATHIFLLLMEPYTQPAAVPGDRADRAPTWLYAAYAITFALCIFSHYLTITVFMCHALYAAIFLRRLEAWLALGLAALGGVVLVLPWFVWGSGRYHFATLASQAAFYRNIALTNPYGSDFGIILPATLPNIAKRGIPIFTDLFLFTNGLGSALAGLRNSSLALGLGGLVTLVLHRYRSFHKPPVWVYGAVPIILAAGVPFYTVVPLRLLVLSVSLPFFYLIGRYVIDRATTAEKRLVVMLLLLAFVPTFFLLIMAWRSGHTFGITQRYSGFSFPYVCLLVAMGVRQLATLAWWFSLPIALVLAVQAVFVSDTINKIYQGTEPKYTQFSQARIQNPYWASAQALIRRYAPGDTILYPNRNRVIYDAKLDRTPFRVALLDAQLVNTYLPHDARYIQRIDPGEPDRIVLVKGKTGQKILIFNFEGTKYRY